MSRITEMEQPNIKLQLLLGPPLPFRTLAAPPKREFCEATGSKSRSDSERAGPGPRLLAGLPARKGALPPQSFALFCTW